MTLLLQWRNELLRLFARKRTYMGFLVFLATELVILALLHTRQARGQLEAAMGRSGLDAGNYFSALTLAVIIVTVSFSFLAPLFLALVGGDIVAKDVEDGTMRMILSRPVTRWQVLLVKWATALVFALSMVVFIGATSLLAGILIRGPSGHLFIFHPEENIFSFFRGTDGFRHYFLALLVLLGPAAAATSIAFMLSCCNIKPSAATVLTLAILFADLIISNVPYFRPFRTMFLQHQMLCWLRVFHDAIPWWTIGGSLCYLAALCITCFIVGGMVFCTRDLK